jgi:hypothetical protein
MSGVLNSAEIEAQHVELLPARTVLSMFSTGGDDYDYGYGDCYDYGCDDDYGLLGILGL